MISKESSRLAGKRFLYELPAIIANAEEGNEVACSNIIYYYKEMIKAGETPHDDVIDYLLSALSYLSKSEKERIAEVTPSRLIESLPQMTKAAIKRLVKKLTAIPGRTFTDHDEECKRIKIGAEVAKLHTKYKNKGSSDYKETKRLGFEPRQRAVEEIAKNHPHSEAQIIRMYKLYKEYKEMGCIDEDGKFILEYPQED